MSFERRRRWKSPGFRSCPGGSNWNPWTGAAVAEKAPKAGLYQLVETPSLQFELLTAIGPLSNFNFVHQLAGTYYIERGRLGHLFLIVAPDPTPEGHDPRGRQDLQSPERWSSRGDERLGDRRGDVWLSRRLGRDVSLSSSWILVHGVRPLTASASKFQAVGDP